MEAPLTGPPAAGRLAENVMHFARLLRAAGVPTGPGKVLDALRAVEIAGVARRDDLYWTLASVFVDRHERLPLFREAFDAFWRDPGVARRHLHRNLPSVHGRTPPRGNEIGRRLAEALARDARRDATPPAHRIELDAAFTASPREVLKAMDFESMSQAELAEAKAMLARLKLPLPQLPTRRHVSDPGGPRVDLRATLRASVRAGPDSLPLKRRSQRRRAPPLVILCDISGSMSRYSRMLLHFLHAVANDRDRIHTLTFGTRLTNITRHLQHNDVDVAMRRVSRAIADWSGGTRIGACLKEFNLRWSRRLLAQGAVVLLISDGLDCDAGEGLAREMERLHKSCRRLIWLNPLLRYGDFEAKPAGIKAMLPHVDAFLPAHNVQSLLDLGRALDELAR